MTISLLSISSLVILLNRKAELVGELLVIGALGASAWVTLIVCGNEGSAAVYSPISIMEENVFQKSVE